MRERVAPPFAFQLPFPVHRERASCCCHEAVAKPGERRRRAEALRAAVLVASRTGISLGGNAQASHEARSAGRLPVVALLLWALFAFVVPSFVQALNLVDIFAFPLGYFMAAQGVLIAFVIIGVSSARWQDRREARRAADG